MYIYMPLNLQPLCRAPTRFKFVQVAKCSYDWLRI